MTLGCGGSTSGLAAFSCLSSSGWMSASPAGAGRRLLRTHAAVPQSRGQSQQAQCMRGGDGWIVQEPQMGVPQVDAS